MSNDYLVMQGHVLEVLRTLPAASVHCMVTSPPYWSLRKYPSDCQVQIWPGNSVFSEGWEQCQHQWEDEGQLPDRGDMNRGFNARWGNSPGERRQEFSVDKKPSSSGRFCSLCGAWQGSLGLEPSVGLYLDHLVLVMREVWRVMRDDSTCWLNIGDSYSPSSTHPAKIERLGYNQISRKLKDTFRGDNAGMKAGDLCLIPHQLALRLRDAGWYVRCDIIWNKGSGMPESVNGVRWERCRVKLKSADVDWREAARSSGGIVDAPDAVGHVAGGNTGLSEDSNPEYAPCPGCDKCRDNDGWILRRGSWRPTRAHEFILMLTKSGPGEYYADREGAKEPLADVGKLTKLEKRGYRHAFKSQYAAAKEIQKAKSYPDGRDTGRMGDYVGKNARSVWQLSRSGGSSNTHHTASFPESLPEKCIAASTSEYGVCGVCGAQYARMVETVQVPHSGLTETKYDTDTMTAGRLALMRQAARAEGEEYVPVVQTVGWKATCNCGSNVVTPAVVLDPFVGSGTTLLVARRMGRRGIGIEVAPEYCVETVKRVEGIGGIGGS